MMNKDNYQTFTQLLVGGKSHKSKITSNIRISTVAPLIGSAIKIKELDIDPDKIKYIKDLFPDKKNVDRNDLIINQVGLYSMTKCTEALKLIYLLKKTYRGKLKKATVLDTTSGIGGFILNIYDHFKYVIGYEIDNTQYMILRHNCTVYRIPNVELHNSDYTQHINDRVADIVLIDPPWGGLQYTESKSLDLKLGNYTMLELIGRIPCKILVIKIPSNHNMDIFINCGYWYTIHNIGNYKCVLVDKTIHKIN